MAVPPNAETPPPETAPAHDASAEAHERRSRDIRTNHPFGQPPPGRAYEVLTAGERFGNYQISRCIAYDLLGSLYQIEPLRAREESPPSLFVLPPMVEHDNAFRKRFKTDARRLCELEHENILSYKEAAEIDGRLCFKLGHFDGLNLIDYLESVSAARDNNVMPAAGGNALPELMADRTTGLPPEEVRSILKQLATAVDFAHRRGFRHLSLNPTNMMRDAEGRVKVLGFGLLDITGTKLFDELASAGIPPISIGKVRMRVNTVDILSPEVRLGRQGDNRSDIYALGITTYWLLTGRKPSSNYVPPSQVNAAIPEQWDALVAKCLERDPDKRYQSAAALLRDLDKLEQLGKHDALDPGTAETRSVFRHIDFIPLPKALERRSRTAARLIRLTVLGLLGAGIVGAAQFFTVTLFEKPPETPPEVVSRPSPTLLANVVFEPGIETAQLVFPDTGDSFLIRNGRLPLYVAPGSHKVKLSATGYQDVEQTIRVGESRSTVKFELQQKWGRLVVNGLPGTKVTAIPKEGPAVELGVVGPEGILVAEKVLPIGEYTIDLSKADYGAASIPGVELLQDDTTTLEPRLMPMAATVRVLTQPTGAAVTSEGKVLGITPLTLSDLPANQSIALTIAKPGYRPASLTVRPQPNSYDTLQLPPLEPLLGAVQTQVRLAGQQPTPQQRASLEVSLKGVEDAADANGRFAGLRYGAYIVTAQHPDYFPAQKQVRIQSETEDAPAPFNLNPRPARIEVKPEQDLPFELHIDGKPQKPQKDGSFRLNPLEEQTLQVHVRDYFPQTHTVSPGPNESLSWPIKLTMLPGPEISQPYTIPYLDLDIVWISPGKGTIGTPLKEHARLPTEGPETKVAFAQGFWIGKTEVTQQAWTELMDDNPSGYPGPQKPIANISWNDAQAFLSKLNAAEKAAGRLPESYVYRLPTEAEWEYTARGRLDGSNAEPFHFGSNASSEVGRFMGLYPRDYTRHIEAPEDAGPYPVGSYAANGFGLFDIHGNVAEWCHDFYGSRLPGGEVENYAGPSSGTRRVVRGGGWRDDAAECRLGFRGDGTGPSTTDENIGFRLVLGPALP
ncbi:MAG: SUMF1/EgtB/PvdO family nonheme iron enzyme [Opitutales bacterium]